jgi:hypothetical protein
MGDEATPGTWYLLHLKAHHNIEDNVSGRITIISKCHVTSNKVTSKLECAEDKFQTRGWVPGREK